MPTIRWPDGSQSYCPHGSSEGEWAKACDCTQPIEKTFIITFTISIPAGLDGRAEEESIMNAALDAVTSGSYESEEVDCG